jgi:hypothetical protein
MIYPNSIARVIERLPHNPSKWWGDTALFVSSSPGNLPVACKCIGARMQKTKNVAESRATLYTSKVLVAACTVAQADDEAG